MLKFFEQYPELVAVMSKKEDGSMKLFVNSDLNLDNRKKFFQKIKIADNKIIAAEIVHGIKVELVDGNSTEFIFGVDGLITKDENVFLTVTVADCIPVYIYEPESKIVGIVHCGWRGIVGGIVENAIAKVLEIGGKAENIKISLGPGINKCHFEIGKDVTDRFEKYSEFIIKDDEKFFVDLKGIINKQLNDLEIKKENIEDNQECTMEHDEKYFSFRRDKPEKVEAMLAVIGIKSCF